MDMQTPVTFIVAFVIVLALIGLVTWLIRRFAGNRLGGSTARGRMPRLAVIDAAAVDGRRRLVLVRRDNVEHLLMIGGPSDIVVEPNIVRAAATREPAGPRPSLGDLPPRPAPFPENEDLLPEIEEPAPAAPNFPPRPPRPASFEDTRRSAPRPSADPLAGFAPEPRGRPEPKIEPRPEPRAEARVEPRLEPRAGLREAPPMRPIPREPVSPRPPLRSTEPPHAPPPEPEARPGTPTPTAEENLAEMAQRLEAALRRPGGAPPAGETPTPAAPAAEPAKPAAPPAPSKGAFENLEDEMASLLGRPKSPS